MTEETALVVVAKPWQTGLIDIDHELEIQENYTEFRSRLLKKGVHYGTMPGVKKDFLWQAGAEAFYKAIGVRPQYDILDHEVDRHSDYCYFLVKAQVRQIGGDEILVGEGIGACSSLEFDAKCPVKRPKHPTGTDNFVVECAEHGTGLGKSGWEWGQAKGQKIYHVECSGRTAQSLARTLQNVQSRANKRAMVAAIRTVGAISEMFTQDEDLVERNRAASARPVGPGSDDDYYGEDDWAADEAPPPSNGRPQSKSGQGVRREPAGQVRTTGQTGKAAPKAAAKGKPTAGGEPEKISPKFLEEVKKGFALIKEAGVSGAELRGWAEDRGLLQPGEELTGRVAYRYASQMDPPPASDEDAVASFATTVLEMLKAEEEVVDGEFTEAPVDEARFGD